MIVSRTVVREDKQDFGIVGVTTPNLPLISSPGGTVVDPNLAAVVQSEVDALLSSGVNKIIFISHLQGIDEDIALAAMVDGIDVMVAGGGDELLARPTDPLIPGDEPSGHYPQLATDINGTIVPVVTTAGSYGYLGDLEVDWDKNGNVVSWSGGPIRVAGGDEPDAVAADPAMQSAVVDPVAEFLADLSATVVASSQVGLDGVREHIRSVETNEGNLIADAYFAQATALAPAFGLPLPDVALTNGGGIRNDSILPAGDITALDTFDMLPFGNFVAVVPDVTRAEFKALIEETVRSIDADGSGGDGVFAQISGFTVNYDSTLPAGSRVTSIKVGATSIVAGGAVVAGPNLTVATNAFSSGGGDGWFGGPPGDLDRVTLGVTDQQALQSYLENDLAGLVTSAAYPEDAGDPGSCDGARIINDSVSCVNQFPTP